MMFGYDGDFSAWGWVLMSLSMVAFWALVIVGIVAAARYFGAAPDRIRGPVPRTPQEVLAERYARGEIDEDEYQRRLKALQNATSTPAFRG
jgi:putative membrane protein